MSYRPVTVICALPLHLWRTLTVRWLLQTPPGDLWRDRAVREANRARLRTHLPTSIRAHLFGVAAGVGSFATLKPASAWWWAAALLMLFEVGTVTCFAGLLAAVSLPAGDD